MGINKNTEAKQYLTFTLDAETYAIKIDQVREVLDMTKITKVPKMPEFIRGVINLRGRVVPVVDLRRKFGISITENTVDTCVMVMEVDVDDEKSVIGAIADSVREVITFEPENIEPAPKLGTRLSTDFITGMSKIDDEFIILLNVGKVFSVDELESAHNIHKTSDELLKERAELLEPIEA